MSMFGGGAPSLADIAAVTRNNDGNDGFGGNNGWWVLIILFALFGGWGNNRNNGGRNGSGETTVIVPPMMGGYGMGTSASFTDAAVQRGFDNQTVVQKLDGISNGICSLGYDQLAQMNGLGTTVMQTGFGLQQAINDNTVAGMQNTNALSTQLASCCCDIRGLVKDLMYTMATDTCALKTEIHETGDRLSNQMQWGFNSLTQTVKDGFVELQRQNDQRYIAELERKLANCDRSSELQSFASYIVDQVRPTPRPTWNVPNPWAGCGCDSCGRLASCC